MTNEARDRLGRLERLVPPSGAPIPEASYGELEQEHDDYLAGLDRLSAAGEHVAALQLASLLGRFWMDSGRLDDGRRRIERLLAAAPDAPPRIRARALYAAGMFAFRQGDDETARRRHELSLACARDAGDVVAEATAHAGLARCGLREGDLEQAREHAREGERIYRELGDEAALDVPLHLLAYADYVAGDDDRARAGFEGTLALNRRLGNARNVARELTNLGSVETRAGNLERAQQLCGEALQLAAESGSAYLIPYCIVNLGGVAGARGHHERAARLLAAGKAMFDAGGAAIDPGTAIEYERHVERARAALGSEAYEAAAEAGRSLTRDEAIREAGSP